MLTLAVTIYAVRQAFKASSRGNFPLFSIDTVEAIWPYLAITVVALALTLFAGKKE